MRHTQIKEQDGRRESNNLNDYIIYKWITHTNKRTTFLKKDPKYVFYETHFVDKLKVKGLLKLYQANNNPTLHRRLWSGSTGNVHREKWRHTFEDHMSTQQQRPK